MASTPALVASASFKTFTTPARKTSLADSYILHLAAVPGTEHYAAAASAPANAVHIVDRRTLVTMRTLPAPAPIRAMRVAAEIAGAGPLVLACGDDGVVAAWDARAASSSPALQLKQPGGPRPALLSLAASPDGRTIAAGTALAREDAFIHFWDARAGGAPARTHGATHADDVTVLAFAPEGETGADQAGLSILSAGADGLVCISNADEADEDEAVVAVGNWGCSVAQAGWLGGSGHGSRPRVWAASDMETFSVWSDELDLVQSLDVRAPALEGTWTTDYLIGCSSASPEDGLRVFAGSNAGDIALLTPSFPSAPGPRAAPALALWDEANGVLLTGGEDAVLCAWPCPPLSAEEEAEADAYADTADTADADTADADADADNEADENSMDVDPAPAHAGRKRALDRPGRRRDVDDHDRVGKRSRRA